MNLIANTGIQLFSTPIEIDLNNNFKMYFHEWMDLEDHAKKLEIAHYFSDEDVWLKKNHLYANNLGYAIRKNNYMVKDSFETISKDRDFDANSIIKIDPNNEEDSGCFEISASKIKDIDWTKFENNWFPMPFFQMKGETSQFGPTNWCRFKLVPTAQEGKKRKYNLIIAFDTKTIFREDGFQNEDLQETPIFTNISESQKSYGLCNTEEGLLGFCSEQKNCGWVDKYLLKHFHEVSSINDNKMKMPKFKYLAQFIFLNRYIQQFCNIPGITLYSNLNKPNINVDLVVDIGNSRTCAILFDDGDFKKSSPLELQDFSKISNDNGLIKYRDSFDMRLAFRKVDLGGNFGLVNSKQFTFPSLIRLGKEANDLIHRATNLNTGAEKISTFSSPKRFLWDENTQHLEWEFVQLEGEKPQPIYVSGISEQLNEDGTIDENAEGSIRSKYSRKALMTFSFIEILAQAQMQINSYEQRKHWGKESSPRKIGKIIVTCPTAMSQKEQVSLRKCAEDAAIILDRYFKGMQYQKLNIAEYRQKISIIPSSAHLSLREEKKQWIYDEATAAQFVFIYAEVKERYQNNVKEYFKLYGKSENENLQSDKNSLTIGSVDIGAGTTDVMIAKYTYDDNNGMCKLTPTPLFWESFYFAGDDLLKQLIRLLIIEGEHSPIQKKLIALGKKPIEILHPFLGTDVGISFHDRRLRSDFNLQISVPLISHFLQLLNVDSDDMQVTFDQVFNQNQPSNSVLNHFEERFGFRFQDLTWNFEKKYISSLIERTFDSLIGKISTLLSYYSCDIVLLSGRPSSLKPITDLFLKYYAIAPNRLKSMNDYRVGTWYPQDSRYPFTDGNGQFTNPKSIITTGAMIGYLAENGGLSGFSLDLNTLKKQLLPTTQFFGKLHNESFTYGETIITPSSNQAKVEINYLPFRIGTRQLDVNSYPSRPFYNLDFNDYFIKDRVLGKYDLGKEPDLSVIEQEVRIEKEKIKKSMPLFVSLERDISNDIETVKIEEITDSDGKSINKKYFSLQIQSMSELENFWLDSGVFKLNIQTSNF